MDDIIGADAAKLAGLQIDFLAKVRDGVITLSQFEWFSNLSVNERNRLCGQFSSPQKNLNLKKFLTWLKKNGLESKLPVMKQIAEQEVFYQKFYGKNFYIDRKKIIIQANRLPAIKAGLESGCINKALIIATPFDISDWSTMVTEADYFYKRLIEPLEKDGFQIWAKTGTDRWTGLTLAELLARCNPTEPEEFDPVAFKSDWAAETKNILGKIPPSRVQSGTVRVVFTSDLVDIPIDQKIINKAGEIVVPENRSYVSAISEDVRVLSHAEGIVLESQLFFKNKTYLTRNTWEWRRDLVEHRDKSTNTDVSVASADSDDGGFGLDSFYADDSCSYRRLRLAL